MGQQNFLSKKLMKWFSFWGQKLYIMGEWNYINKLDMFNYIREKAQENVLQNSCIEVGRAHLKNWKFEKNLEIWNKFDNSEKFGNFEKFWKFGNKVKI